MEDADLTKRLFQYAKEKEIDLIGATDAGCFICRPWKYDQNLSHYLPCKKTEIAPNTYDPRVVMPQAKAVIIVGMYMYGFDKIIPDTPGIPRGNIGPWTRGYVEAGRYAVDKVESFLAKEGYHTVFSNEIPYRTLAVKCGLGAIGKNGFLYHENMGSYIRLGAVLTDAPIEKADMGTESRNDCGRCKVCINNCPTGALRGENDLDADYCLHLWQQGQGIYGECIPPEERHKCGNYLMRTGGCLSICPRNRNLVPRERFPFEAENKEDSPELIPLVLAEEAEYMERLPYHVYKYGITSIRRDAIIALGNSKDPAAVPVLIKGLKQLSGIAKGLCAWALGEMEDVRAIKMAEVINALEQEMQEETDMLVCEEISSAVKKLKRRFK